MKLLFLGWYIKQYSKELQYSTYAQKFSKHKRKAQLQILLIKQKCTAQIKEVQYKGGTAYLPVSIVLVYIAVIVYS